MPWSGRAFALPFAGRIRTCASGALVPSLPFVPASLLVHAHAPASSAAMTSATADRLLLTRVLQALPTADETHVVRRLFARREKKNHPPAYECNPDTR